MIFPSIPAVSIISKVVVPILPIHTRQSLVVPGYFETIAPLAKFGKKAVTYLSLLLIGKKH